AQKIREFHIPEHGLHRRQSFLEQIHFLDFIPGLAEKLCEEVKNFVLRVRQSFHQLAEDLKAGLIGELPAVILHRTLNREKHVLGSQRPDRTYKREEQSRLQFSRHNRPPSTTSKE